MPRRPFSRRQFLGGSFKVGAGAAALGLTGVAGLDVLAHTATADTALADTALADTALADTMARRAAAGVFTTAPEPRSVQNFVSRPDLTPPGISITQATDVKTIANQPQYIFLCPRPNFGSPQPIASQGLMICNLYGELVWWQQAGTAYTDNPFDLRVQTYQGKPALTWYTGMTGTGYGEHGTGSIAGSDYAPITSVSTDLYQGMDLHEFQLTPQDTALVTSYEYDSSEKLVYGHALEIDIATNTVVWDWSSRDQVPQSSSYVTTEDYFHINSINLWPGSARNVLISSRNTWCVYLVDRKTQDIIWRLGGKESDFSMGPGTAFEYAHDARPLTGGTGISLFDDASPAGKGSPPTPEKQSWGKVFSVNEDTMEVGLLHEFNHPDQTFDSGAQGNNQVLPTGGHFVGWGGNGFFTLFGASGSAVVPPALLDGRLPKYMGNYRSYMFDWVGNPPESEIKVVVHATAGTGNFRAWMTWNGATEIDSWRLNAGTSSSSLVTIDSKKKAGFEVIMDFTRVGATAFEAVALDVNGAVLGRSAITSVSS